MITGTLPTQYLFNRNWSVLLTPVIASGKDQFGNQLYQPSSTGQLFQQDQNGNNLRVVFDFTKTSEGQSNKGKVEVWNLNATSRKSFQKGAQLTLKAGYQNLVKTILTADVLANHVTIERRGSDVVTIFECGSSERQVELTIISKNYPPGIDFASLIRDCTQTMGLSVSTISGIENFNYNSSVTLSGSVKSCLNKLCSANGLEWNINDDELYIKPKGQAVQGTAIVLASGLDELGLPTENTGLIGEPSRADGGITRFVGLLNPDLNPGQLVQLVSQNVNGFFQIRTANYKGDSHGHDWHIACESTEIPGLQQVVNQANDLNNTLA